MSKAEKWAERLLAPAGITINGKRPYDLQIEDIGTAVRRVIAGGEKAACDLYVEGKIWAQQYDEFIARVLRARRNKLLNSRWHEWWMNFLATIRNAQSVARSWQVGKKHYDLGNDFYALWLDTRWMAYTCADFTSAETLEDAQEAKIAGACDAIELEPGQTVLDIGSGWGGFLNFATRHRGAGHGFGVTVSVEQADYARRFCFDLPVTIFEQDYRKTELLVDHAVSIEMVEAVGHKNARTYMETVHRAVRPGGNFRLQAICGNEPAKRTSDWLGTYIFVNGTLLSREQILEAARGLFELTYEDEVGDYYDLTLMEWDRRFVLAYTLNPAMAERLEALFRASWPKLAARGGTFFRMWRNYLLMCAGSFRRDENGYAHNRLRRFTFKRMG